MTHGRGGKYESGFVKQAKNGRAFFQCRLCMEREGLKKKHKGDSPWRVFDTDAQAREYRDLHLTSDAHLITMLGRDLGRDPTSTEVLLKKVGDWHADQ